MSKFDEALAAAHAAIQSLRHKPLRREVLIQEGPRAYTQDANDPLPPGAVQVSYGYYRIETARSSTS